MTARGKPSGWTPQSELDHFMRCPGCGKIFDMRDLGQAVDHLHDGPDDAPAPEKAVAKEARKLS
jgi:uncharacterized C2H2 Zn-finger protein